MEIKRRDVDFKEVKIMSLKWIELIIFLILVRISMSIRTGYFSYLVLLSANIFGLERFT